MTQKEKVLNHIKKYGYITSLDGLKLNIVDVRGVVRFLKNDGIDIKSRFVVNPKTKSVYKVYALKNKSIDSYETKLGGKRV